MNRTHPTIAGEPARVDHLRRVIDFAAAHGCAPSLCTLAAQELVSLIDVPTAAQHHAESYQRAQRIRRAVDTAGRVDIPALRERFGVSRWAINRALHKVPGAVAPWRTRSGGNSGTATSKDYK